MLKGFTVPRSPRGAAALTPPPPWHYAADVLAVEFWSDPDVSASMLPNEVELDARLDNRPQGAKCRFRAEIESGLGLYLPAAVVLRTRRQDVHGIGVSVLLAVLLNEGGILAGFEVGVNLQLPAVGETKHGARQLIKPVPVNAASLDEWHRRRLLERGIRCLRHRHGFSSNYRGCRAQQQPDYPLTP